AIVLSFLALALTFLFQADALAPRWRSHGSALLRGSANPVMHYLAMAATIFTFAAVDPDFSHAVNIASLGLLGNSVVPGMVLVVALLTTVVDRARKQKALLDELFDQAPQAVALMSVDER